MKTTKIQWCHSTINPVMGCDGFELWPGRGILAQELTKTIAGITEMPPLSVKTIVDERIRGLQLSELYTNRKVIAEELLPFGSNHARGVIVDVIRRNAKCYAGQLGT